MNVPPPNYPPPPPPPSTPPPPPPGGGDGSPATPKEPRRFRRLTGALLGLLFLVVLVGIGFQLSNGFSVIIGGILLAVIGSTFAMFSSRVRPYAAGFLIAVALVIIVIGGACIGIIASMDHGA